MSSRILDGKALAHKTREALRGDIERVRARLGRPPGLAVVLVGDDPASAIYVRNKERAALELGLASEVVRLPATASQAEVAAAVDGLNARREVDGFLVQLPLPRGLDAEAITQRVDPQKDADGLHTVNLGKLVVGEPGPRPCTAAASLALLDEAGVDLAGKHAVVIGRSTIVGKPTALMLLERHATVTVCHSRTRDLAEEVRRADVVIAAVGRPRLVQGDWIKAGAVVIDVGINRVGDKVVGDVDFDAARARASAITPVPGGVGPMTIAMLISNTVQAALRSL